MSILKKAISYLFELPVLTVKSKYSGDLTVVWSQGRKVLNTTEVNYSFQSLHRVFKWSFKKAGLPCNINRVLILGLGGGSIPEIIRKNYEIKAPIDVVEIDEAVINLAVTEFNLHQYDPVLIIHEDATAFILQISHRYDLICMDVFIHDKVPMQLLHPDSLKKMIDALNPGGKLFINTMVTDHLPSTELLTLMGRLISTGIIESGQFEIYNPDENNRMIVITK